MNFLHTLENLNNILFVVVSQEWPTKTISQAALYEINQRIRNKNKNSQL